MTQKSILSFFVPKNSKAEESLVKTDPDNIGGCADDSPVKTTNRKRIRMSSSSSENERVSYASKSDSKGSTTRKSSKKTKISEFEETFEYDVKKKPVKNENIKKENAVAVSKRPDENEKEKEINIKEKKSKKNEKNEPEVVSVELFNPASPKYHPIKDACWKRGQKVPYYALAKTFEEIENISARLKMIDALANYLRSVVVLTPEDLLPSIYLSLNKTGPTHEGFELGIAEQTLIRAISQSTGRTVTQIKNEVQEVGDLGAVAEKTRLAQKLLFKPAPLTISGIFKKFTEIANMTGKTAVNKKIAIIENLFVACKGPEAKFLMRSLNGKLRIGLAEHSVLHALALACALTPPGQSYPPEKINVASTMSSESFKSLVDELSHTLKATYFECPNYEMIIPVLLNDGIQGLPKKCKITPGLPMKPMLAQPTKGVQEVLTRFDGLEFTCEWKYDGERAQIHYSPDGVCKIFSRNQEDNTPKYPDITSRISKVMKKGVTSFIIDSEAVAWNKSESRILPFQILSTRKRKDVRISEIKVSVCVYMFDLLYLNGEPLVKKTFYERRRLLRENFNAVEGEWMFATAIDTSKMEEVQEFLEESVKGNCEGLMVKTLKEDATYEIAKRSRNWLKLKKDYLEGVGDTLDLVVIGGYLGKGKRTGTYGGFLVSCYDADSEEFQSVCKLGTGFTDETLAAHTKFLQTHIISKPPSYYQYDPSLEPDHWFEPVQVWEIKCADLSLSPVHRAAVGVVDSEKGISLRFPRFLRIREDKKPEEATTSQQMIELYNNQEQIKNQHDKTSNFNEEDFY